MSGSNVGNAQVYEAGDQRNYAKGDAPGADRYKEGQPNSHKANDSSESSLIHPNRWTLTATTEDERTIANKLAREEQREKEPDSEKSVEAKQVKQDPTLPAKFKGNEPSKGAKIDKELQEEEEEILKKKGNFGPN